MNQHIKLLTECEAPKKYMDFASKYTTMVETVANCGDAGWLYWTLRLLPVKERVRHACYMFRNTPTKTGSVWDLIADERSRTAIETAERWADGLVTDEELGIARDAAINAYCAHPDAAWAAARASLDIILAASDASDVYHTLAASDAIYWAARASDSGDAYEWQSEYITSIDWSFCDTNMTLTGYIS